MAAPQRLQAAPAADAGMVEVTVFRGTVQGPKGRQYGPGETVSVSPEDAAMLRANGTVKGDDYVAPAEVQTGALKLTATDGPQIGVPHAILG